MTDQPSQTPLVDAELARLYVNAADTYQRYSALANFARDLELALSAARRDAETERAIVDRIWNQLGRPNYAELKGRSIHDLIAALTRDAERYRWLRANPNFIGWEHDFMPEQVDKEIDRVMTAAAKGGQ